MPFDLKKKLTHLINFGRLQVSYSQEGEDILIDRILNFKKDGFYVDIGAYHPVKYSNTYKFYLKGWRGINIDAMPGSMEIFKKIRPHDVNLEIPISDKSEKLLYHVFSEQGLNTFSETEAEKKKNIPGYSFLRTETLLTQRVDETLKKHLAPGSKIDFMSVDVEGFDLKVLRSNDWTKYRPALVLAENLSSYNNIQVAIDGDTNGFMKSVNYTLFAKTYNTLFFVENNMNLT